MLVNYIEQGDDKRKKLIGEILPKQTITSLLLEPAIERLLFAILAECVISELEIYRLYPKRNKEKPVEKVKTFDPRTNDKCFMGKSFKANNHITDSELFEYRKAVGTINHPIWGDCTLMEIWGGDHFEEHNEMVVNAFRYGIGLIDERPEIRFYTNPLFQNKKSKEFKLSAEQQEYKKEMDELLAKALIFGVRTPIQARNARKRN